MAGEEDLAAAGAGSGEAGATETTAGTEGTDATGSGLGFGSETPASNFADSAVFAAGGAPLFDASEIGNSTRQVVPALVADSIEIRPPKSLTTD